MTAVVTREALLEAARSALRPGITPSEAIIVGYSQLVGEPLDPFAFDDAAILERATRLVEDGFSASEALATARDELIRWEASNS